jgi:hypothetical protein
VSGGHCWVMILVTVNFLSRATGPSGMDLQIMRDITTICIPESEELDAELHLGHC